MAIAINTGSAGGDIGRGALRRHVVDRRNASAEHPRFGHGVGADGTRLWVIVRSAHWRIAVSTIGEEENVSVGCRDRVGDLVGILCIASSWHMGILHLRRPIGRDHGSAKEQ